MKRVATWTGRNEASIAVHPIWKSGKCPSKSRRRAGERKRQTERRERQLEPLKFSFIWGLSSLSHMSVDSRVRSHYRVVSNQIRRWFLKLFWAWLWLPCPVLVCPQPLMSSEWDLQSFPESFFFHSSSQKQTKKSWCLVLNISISVYRYMFVFTVGKRWPFTAKPCLCCALCKCPLKSSIPM